MRKCVCLFSVYFSHNLQVTLSGSHLGALIDLECRPLIQRVKLVQCLIIYDMRSLLSAK